MTHPGKINGSLELEPSNVAVDENLTNHDPPHIFPYRTPSGPRTTLGYAGKH